MIIDYIENKRYFDSHRYSDKNARKYSDMLCKIEEFIDPSDIKLFYPKNLFVDDKDLEVYVILDRNILRGRILDDNKMELTTLRLKDLLHFKCECTYNIEGFHKLTLRFKNDEVVIFDSMEDSNDSWRYKFENQIKELTKLFVQS